MVPQFERCLYVDITLTSGPSCVCINVSSDAQCPSSPDQVVTLNHRCLFNKVSRQLRRLPCLSGSCCDWTPPPHPLLHSDWAKRGAEGRSPWRRWCMVAGSSEGSASPRCLLLPSERQTHGDKEPGSSCHASSRAVGFQPFSCQGPLFYPWHLSRGPHI